MKIWPAFLQNAARGRTWLFWAAGGLFVCLFLSSFVPFAKIPESRRFLDLQKRQAELRSFESGLYPNKRLNPPGALPRRARTVYPPTSLPQLWLVSPWTSYRANVLTFLLLNAAALAIILRHAWQVGRVGGRPGAWLAATAMLGMASAAVSIKVGQHGLLINALLVLMVQALDRGRPLLAGVAWMAAMVKPQIALGHAVQLVARHKWTALLTGGLLLLLAGWAACAYTGHTLPQVLEASYGRQAASLSYAARGWTLVTLFSHLGLSRHAAVLMGFVATATMLLPFLLPPLAKLPPLVHLAAAGVAGRVGFYHIHYDDVMLAFLLLALLENALRTRRRLDWTVTLATGATLWVPMRLFALEIDDPGGDHLFPGHPLLMVLWPLSLVYLILAALRRARDARTGRIGQ